MTRKVEDTRSDARALWRQPLVRRIRAGDAENNAGSGADFNGRLS